MMPFTHINAITVKEACALLDKHKGKAALNAGGTDLIGVMKSEMLFGYPETVINIETIPGLDSIKEKGDFLMIGALTRLSSIIKSPVIKESCEVLIDAARSVATS